MRRQRLCESRDETCWMLRGLGKSGECREQRDQRRAECAGMRVRSSVVDARRCNPLCKSASALLATLCSSSAHPRIAPAAAAVVSAAESRAVRSPPPPVRAVRTECTLRRSPALRTPDTSHAPQLRHGFTRVSFASGVRARGSRVRSLRCVRLLLMRGGECARGAVRMTSCTVLEQGADGSRTLATTVPLALLARVVTVVSEASAREKGGRPRSRLTLSGARDSIHSRCALFSLVALVPSLVRPLSRSRLRSLHCAHDAAFA